jgi:uncharacterized protein YjbI with pentapeptide repeats
VVGTLSKLRRRPSHGTVVSYIALFIALATGGAYAANEWNGSNIQDGTLTGADIQDLSLGLPDYGANSISTGKLKDQDVRTQDLRDLGVTNPKIAWDSVSSGKVINNNLTGADIADNNLTGWDINEFTLSGVRLSGWQHVNRTSSFNSDSPKYATVYCPYPKRPIGSGYHIDGGDHGDPPNEVADVVVDTLSLSILGDSVYARAREEDGTGANWSVTVSAACANAE